MLRDVYDVAIAGGSLAGAMTGYQLTRAGLRVVILEQAVHHPRRKACGEGLFPGGVREIAAAGLLRQLESCSRPLEGVRFNAYGAVACAALGSNGLCARGVRRDALDPLVLDHAEAAGVHVQRGVTVTGIIIDHRRAAGVRTSGGDVQARVVVGADGLHSRVRRLAGLDGEAGGDRYGVSVHVQFDREVEPWVDVHFARDHELYLTPVGPAELNVALLTRKVRMSGLAGDLDASFAAFLRQHPAMPRGWSVTGPASASGPFPRRARRTYRGNVILVGDAAGFYDGITGEGMSLALRSARLCAHAVQQHLETRSLDPFRLYDRERRALARNSEVMGRLMLALGPRERLARWSTRNLARHPETFERLAAINAGEAGLSTLRPRDGIALTLGL